MQVQDIRDAVAARMKRDGISRRQLARESGLDKITVGRFLDGVNEPQRGTIVTICTHFGLPVPPTSAPSGARPAMKQARSS